jgi:hypothetical protein
MKTSGSGCGERGDGDGDGDACWQWDVPSAKKSAAMYGR